jgi:hypothetical protein
MENTVVVVVVGLLTAGVVVTNSNSIMVLSYNTSTCLNSNPVHSKSELVRLTHKTGSHGKHIIAGVKVILKVLTTILQSVNKQCHQ